MILLAGAGLGVVAVLCWLSHYGHSSKKHRLYTSRCPPPPVLPTDLVYRGKSMEWEWETLHAILSKYNHYYNALNTPLQVRFIKRLKRFMVTKTFIVKNNEAFREMPVLVSAAAVQLTFGLPAYRFRFYKYIRLYPGAYTASHTSQLLAGNVEGNTITVAWNHFLEGYRNGADGRNVGLHEMSHALYCQKVYIEEGYAKDFNRGYRTIALYCDELLAAEPASHFFNFRPGTTQQEAWALSVEQFFERPELFQLVHPHYYHLLCLLLQQDPRHREAPVPDKDPISIFLQKLDRHRVRWVAP